MSRESREVERKRAYAEWFGKQEEALRDTVESLPRGATGADYNLETLSDNIRKFQHDAGLVEDDRLGLSPGQKKLLYDAGYETIERIDQSTYEKGVKDARRYDRAAEKIWPLYRVAYGEDDPRDVARAVAALQDASGMSAADLATIADDPAARRAAFEKIHDLSIEIESQRYEAEHYGGGGYFGTEPLGTGDEDVRTAGIMGGGVGSGPAPELTKPEGSIAGDIKQWQKKRGLI